MNARLDHKQSDIERAVEVLNRLAQQRDGRVPEKRSSARVPLCRDMLLSGVLDDEPVQFEVLCRNISESGVCFLSREPLFLPGGVIVLDAERRLAFRIEIVRSRRLQDDLWEHGAQFKQRVLM